VSKTETASSKAPNEAPENLAAAVEALKRGHVIVFPTETLYGLGADALNEAALEIVFQLKGRDPSNPIPVLVANQEMLHILVAKVPTVARKLMDRHWPGPLTLVLPGQKNIPKRLCNPEGKVGVRISSQPIATLLVGLGRPLTATSANPSGKNRLEPSEAKILPTIELF
jgi:L-threonylcarbamoyladenylate synthase